MEEREFLKYNRQIILDNIGIEGQQKLKQAKVLVIGAGGLGSPVLLYLAAAGVGNIGIVDGDVVDESNLHRQVLYNENDIGKLKTEVSARKLSELNRYVNVITYSHNLSGFNALDIIKDYDFIVDSTDNFFSKYLINDACVIAKKPFIYGGVFKFNGQVSVFNYQGGPTYRCLFPVQPDVNDFPTCSEIGVLGVVPAVIGSIQANESLKIILGIGEILSGKLLTFDALTNRFDTFEISPDKNNLNIEKILTAENIFCSGDTVKHITPYELKKMLDEKKDIQIIDVREEFEYERKNINGILIPLKTLPDKLTGISREKPVIIMCEHGERSVYAVLYLQQRFKFTNLYNLEGGIANWEKLINN